MDNNMQNDMEAGVEGLGLLLMNACLSYHNVGYIGFRI